MSVVNIAATRSPMLPIRGKRYPVLLPRVSGPRLHLAATLLEELILHGPAEPSPLRPTVAARPSS